MNNISIYDKNDKLLRNLTVDISNLSHIEHVFSIIRNTEDFDWGNFEDIMLFKVYNSEPYKSIKVSVPLGYHFGDSWIYCDNFRDFEDRMKKIFEWMNESISER